MRRLLSAIPGLAMALCLNASVQAQTPKPAMTTAEKAGASVMAVCSKMWAIKNSGELQTQTDFFVREMNARVEDQQKEHDQLKEDYRKAVNRVEVLRAKAVGSLLGEGAAKRTAESDGVLSKAQVAAVALNAASAEIDGELRLAEDRLDVVKASMNEVRRRLISTQVIAIAAVECAKDQMAYLEKSEKQPPPPPNQGVVPPPPAVAALPGIQQVRGTFTGGWSGLCRQQQNAIPMKGRLVMQLTGDAGVGASFADGAPPAIRGTVAPDGKMTASGEAAFAAGISMTMILTGSIVQNPNGTLKGSGTFSGDHPQGIKCTGQWAN